MARFGRWRTRNIRKAKGIFCNLGLLCRLDLLLGLLWQWLLPLYYSLDGHCKSQIVVKNLRIVAQWWTLSESHLLRLNFVVFQPSVVSGLRWSHYTPCFNFRPVQWEPLKYYLEDFFLHLLIAFFVNFGCLVLKPHSLNDANFDCSNNL